MSNNTHSPEDLAAAGRFLEITLAGSPEARAALADFCAEAREQGEVNGRTERALDGIELAVETRRKLYAEGFAACRDRAIEECSRSVHTKRSLTRTAAAIRSLLPEVKP